MPTDHLHHGSISISTSVSVSVQRAACSVQCAVCSVQRAWRLGFGVLGTNLSHERFGVGLVGSGKRFDFGAVP